MDNNINEITLTKENLIKYGFNNLNIERLFNKIEWNNYSCFVINDNDIYCACNTENLIYKGIEAKRKYYFKNENQLIFPIDSFELMKEYFEKMRKQYELKRLSENTLIKEQLYFIEMQLNSDNKIIEKTDTLKRNIEEKERYLFWLKEKLNFQSENPYLNGKSPFDLLFKEAKQNNPQLIEFYKLQDTVFKQNVQNAKFSNGFNDFLKSKYSENEFNNNYLTLITKDNILEYLPIFFKSVDENELNRQNYKNSWKIEPNIITPNNPLKEYRNLIWKTENVLKNINLSNRSIKEINDFSKETSLSEINTISHRAKQEIENLLYIPNNNSDLLIKKIKTDIERITKLIETNNTKYDLTHSDITHKVLPYFEFIQVFWNFYDYLNSIGIITESIKNEPIEEKYTTTWKIEKPNNQTQIESKVKKDKTQTLWFQVGLLFANGEMDKLINENNSNASEIARKLGNESLRPFISESISKTNVKDKNIFSSAKNMKIIIEHCKANNIKITNEFNNKYNELLTIKS